MNAPLGALSAPPVGATGLALAFSGGRDSTSLLHALTYEADHGLALRAIHVCHHLQPQAEVWVQQCAEQCADWGVSFARIDVQVVDSGQGIEAAARAARYAAFADALQSGEVLVTAHHARDQAETFLLQALRGAGVRGLAGMPVYVALGRGGLWRPWLGVTRAAIEAYASTHELAWIDDPSNADPDIDRGYLRRALLPALAARWPAFEKTLARSASHAAAAAQALDIQAAADLAAVGDAQGALRCGLLAALAAARQSEVIRYWLARTGRDRPDHRHLAGIAALVDARLAASPCVHFADTDVRRFGDRLFCMSALSPAPPTSLRLDWDPARPLILPPGCGTLMMDPPRADLPVLQLRFRQGGERIVDSNGQHQRLKEKLRSAGVAPWIRSRMPLVYWRDALIAVPDCWRHPHIERLLGMPVGAFRWQHELLG